MVRHDFHFENRGLDFGRFRDQQLFGPEAVMDAVPTMGGEDFSAYQQKTPGTFFFVGAGNVAKGIVYPHHHPRFTVDEDAFPIGVKAFVSAVFNLLT